MISRLLVTALLLWVNPVLAQDPEPVVAADTQVIIHTNKGAITLKLFPEAAPKTVENFLQYARDGFYDGTIFHRVIQTFMIQGGGFTADMERKTTREPIENEATNGLKNDRGTIAMARTNAPHSATSQFFINVQDNVALDHTGTESSRAWGYAVFGEVVEGMDVVDEIRFVATARAANGMADVPTETVLIERVEVVE